MYSTYVLIFPFEHILMQLRKIQLKSERSLETRSAEIREGDTYSPNIMG
jgi:hypothetical protein